MIQVAVSVSTKFLKYFCFLAGFLPVGAYSQGELAQIRNPSEQMYEECLTKQSFTPAFCKCAAQISESFGNDPLLWRSFMAGTSDDPNGDEGSKQVLREMLDRTAHDFPALTSKDDREAYVVGRLGIYGRSIVTKCGNHK